PASGAEVGTLDATVAVRAGDFADGLSLPVAVASTHGEERFVQCGLLAGSALQLPLPATHGRVGDAVLDVSVSRNPVPGLEALVQRMVEYPHRCLEQRLSRALVFAYARAFPAGFDLAARTEGAEDGDLATVLSELPLYEAGDGLAFFSSDSEGGSPFLSMYAADAVARAQELGIAVPVEAEEVLANVGGLWQLPRIEERKRAEGWLDDTVSLAVLRDRTGDQRVANVDWLLARLGTLSPFARANLATALADIGGRDADVARVVASLRADGERRGARIVLRGATGDRMRSLASSRRDQCAALEALVRFDQGDDTRDVHRAWLRGVLDGVAQYDDTQAAIYCMAAGYRYWQRYGTGDAAVAARAAVRGGETAAMPLAPGTARAESRFTVDRARPDPATMSLAADAGAELSYQVEWRYPIDLANAPPRADGIGLERHYEVRRNGKWVALAANTLRAGDWVRIVLAIETPVARSYVALTDAIPAAWAAIDPALNGTVSADLLDAQIGGDAFRERQLGDTVARFYAELLPPGRHEVVYYGQVRHAGEFTALPATVELMYGEEVSARTRADRVRVAR
ncbi:MAG TPA: hypothetical protein VFL14_00145, partial [Xanthomonadales bacterium]|nr:hypothetical protein [Xanthomonadales bacterium]